MCARLSKLTECRKYVIFTDVSATSHWADSWRPHPGSSIGLATANFQVGEGTLASYFVVVIAGRLLAGVRFVLMARGTTAYITVLSAATGVLVWSKSLPSMHWSTTADHIPARWHRRRGPCSLSRRSLALSKTVSVVTTIGMCLVRGVQ
jgi:hypothetical protein